MLIGAVALRNYLNADAGVFGSGLVIVVAVVLLLLFIPKVMQGSYVNGTLFVTSMCSTFEYNYIICEMSCAIVSGPWSIITNESYAKLNVIYRHMHACVLHVQLSC